MYYIFDSYNLPQINTSAKASHIQQWKKNPTVSKCFTKLFKRGESGGSFMNQIINKIWSGKKNIPRIKIAFAISTCEIFLDPSNQDIKIFENLMKLKVLQNMVSFINFINLHKI